MTSDTRFRILGIDPHAHGFGFAVFEDHEFLVEWGTARVWGKESAAFVARVETMIARFKPTAVAFPAPPSIRPRKKLRRLASALVHASGDSGVPVLLITQQAVQSVFPADVTTKYQRATHLISIFPELELIMPPPRKPWLPQDERLTMFTALALCIASMYRVP